MPSAPVAPPPPRGHPTSPLTPQPNPNPLSQAHRILIQIVASSSRVLGRAVTAAWRQASATHAYNATNPSDMRSAASRASTLALSGLTLSEACQILNVKPPKRGETDMTHVLGRFKQLFDANEVANGGSFYLQSKVLRARERIEREIADGEEEREQEKLREGWKPKVFKD